MCIPALAQDGEPPTQEPLVLTDEQGEYPLGLHMDILEDPSSELTIAEVSSPEYASSFIPSVEEVPIYGYTDSAFWLRLRLQNQSQVTYQWLLEVIFPSLNYVDLYIPVEEGGYTVKQSGALRPFDTRDLPYYHVVFELPLSYQDEQMFYIRVESGSSMTLAFTLWSPENFAVNKINDMLGVGLFYGALLIMLGYHLFVFYSLKQINYFYFVLVLGSAVLFFASYEGVADQFLWPGWSQYKQSLLAITMSLLSMATLKFSDAFLELKKQSPRLHLLLYLMIGIWGLMIVITPFVSYSTIARLLGPLLVFTPLFAILVGIYHWRKGYRPARFYLISWLGFMLGISAAQMVRYGILPSNAFTERFYHIGLIWLVLMWSLALADKIKTLEAETEKANRRLLQSQHELAQSLDGLPIGAVVYGPERMPTYINPRAKSILSNPDKGIGPNLDAKRTLANALDYYSFRIIDSDQAYPLEQLPVWQAFEGKSASVDDIEADLVDQRVALEIWANPVRDENGNVVSVVAAFQDITQRRQTQKELDEYRHQLEQMVSQRTTELNAANKQLQAENVERQRLENMLRLRLEWLALVNRVNQSVENVSDLPQAYQSFTDMIKKLFGATDALLAEIDSYSKELKLLSHSCQDNAHPDLIGSKITFPFAALFNQLVELETPIVVPRDQLSSLEGPLGAHFHETQSQNLVLVPLRCQDNLIELVGLEYMETEMYLSADEMTLLEKIGIDIHQLQEKAQLAEQSRALIATEERNRLARDLHDSVTQVLFSASLVAEVLPQIWRRDPELAQESLEILRRLTRGALAEMRTMLLELRPSAIIKTPLNELLAQLTEAVTSRNNLPYQLFVEQIPTLPEDVHVSFYRIAQESLNNIVRHAQASQVSVSLSATPLLTDPTQAWNGEVRLMVRDNGRGFDTHDYETQHLGLAIMRERAAATGATLSVESQTGQGTTVTLTWHN